MVGIHLAYMMARAVHDNKKIEDERNKSANIKRSNDEIITELFNNVYFKRRLQNEHITVKGYEGAIREELSKRNFDFKTSDVEIIIGTWGWESYTIIQL